MAIVIFFGLPWSTALNMIVVPTALYRFGAAPQNLAVFQRQHDFRVNHLAASGFAISTSIVMSTSSPTVSSMPFTPRLCG
jgi:hypothetical protein